MKRFLTSLLLACVAVLATAQQMPQLPLDPAVRVGKLENGMTYYIRHNDQPAQRAEFYLLTHAGAVNEAPDQDGLAHFLEHMCFNGTKNFPGKDLLNYLESIGASFGGNINAATGLEQTQYMLNNIPIVREGIIDSCILVMHDYSHFVTCDPAEIDAERGVIIEEKRSRNTAQWRTFMSQKEALYKGTPLAKTSLIGAQTQLETFKPESLVNFYRTWYRPDLQAIVVVGDIDPDAIEAKIKSTFADVPAAENPQPREPLLVVKNTEPIVNIYTDPEATNSSINILWKSDALPLEYRNTAPGFAQDIIADIYNNAMSERFNDLAAKPDCPFIYAALMIEELCEGTDYVYSMVVPKEGKALEAEAALYTEIERMKRYGFTEAEYQRAKASILTGYENAVAKASTRKNAEFIPGIANHFFHNHYLLDPAVAEQIAKAVMPQLTSDMLNKGASQLITDDNMIVMYNAPQKEGLTHPTEADLLGVISTIKASEIAAPVEEESNAEFLDSSKLKGSKVKSEKAGAIEGSTVWMLKNGVKVILMPTEYEKNKISISLTMDGGRSLISDEDIASFDQNIWQLYTQNTGIAGFSGPQVSKMLSGKTVSVVPSISKHTHGIEASTTPKDLETALQLMYLTFVEPRFDADEYEQGLSQIRMVLPNLLATSNYKFQQEYTKTLFGGSKRQEALNEEVLANASLATLEKNYRMLFKGANGATVVVVGDFNTADIKPLVEKYIGSLPKGKATKYVDRKVDVVDGQIENRFQAKMEAPMVTVLQSYKAPGAYSKDKAVAVNALSYIMDMIYTETLRENEGGTYGASTNASWGRIPTAYGHFIVVFQTNEDQAERLMELAKEGMQKVATEGPTEVQFDKTVKNLKKGIPEKRIRNNYWMQVIKDNNRYNENADALYEAAVDALTPEAIKAVAAEFLNSGNFIQVVMSPEK